MAAEDKTFKINDLSYVVTVKQLKAYELLASQGFIFEIILPMMGGMMDDKTKDPEDIFNEKKSTMFKDLFQHIAEKLSDPRLADLLAKMLVGATYKDPTTGTVLPFNLDEFCEHKEGIVTLNELLMFCLEVNFSSLFTENGILQSLTGKTLDLMATA